MTKQIETGIISGVAEAPSSKSITHRLMIMGAMAAAPWRIERPLWSEDTTVTLAALQQLGYAVQLDGGNITIDSTGRSAPSGICTLDVKNSGTSARFLAALAATEEGRESILDGSERMRERPMRELLDALQALGADIDDTNGGLPLRIRGKKLHGTSLTIDASRSSQFLSALLLIAPRLSGELHLHCAGTLASAPYVDMTTALMKQAGVDVQQKHFAFVAETGRPYSGDSWAVEGDYSGAAFLLAAAAVTGGKLEVRNLVFPSSQGDADIVRILHLLGARIEHTADALRIRGGRLRNIDITMHTVPDLVPVTAVMCLFADGPSRLREVGHLRFKESDRIQALVDNAARLGGSIVPDGDDLVITPGLLHGGVIDPMNDHRIAMSFAVAGLRVPGVTISSPDCVDKSFPGFWPLFQTLTQRR